MLFLWGIFRNRRLCAAHDPPGTNAYVPQQRVDRHFFCHVKNMPVIKTTKQEVFQLTGEFDMDIRTVFSQECSHATLVLQMLLKLHALPRGFLQLILERKIPLSPSSMGSRSRVAKDRKSFLAD
jgi:hypothetical protein